MSVAARLRRLADVVRAVRRSRAEAANEHLSPAALQTLQRERLTELVRFAVQRAPFYRELYRGIDLRGPVELAALPTTDKATLMDSFDEWVTDRRLRLSEVEASLADIQAGALHLGEYRVCATGGTSGRRGLFVYSQEEWARSLSLFFRQAGMSGLRPHLPRRRVAVITTVSPLHMSARYSASVDVGLHRVLRLDARRPLREIAAALQAFQPYSLNGYPSVLALLAEEQRAGRLRIAPDVVCTTSEVRTPEMEARMLAAWGRQPFNLYATTETGISAMDCTEHCGLHLFEDYVIVENIDAEGRPVADGEAGHRLLVTNLWNWTQPLIRYELSDMVAIESAPCRCGRTLRRIVALDGRGDDVLVLAARGGGTVPVHPLTVRSPFAANDGVREYQVVYDGERLTVRLVPQATGDRAQLADRVRRDLQHKLREAGAEPPPIAIELVDDMQRNGSPSGKFKLIEVRRAAPPAPFV